MTGLQLREATTADAAPVVNLANAAYRGNDGWTSEYGLISGTRLCEEMVGEMLQHANQKLLLFKEGNELSACIHLERDGDSVHFGCFCVDPKQQGSGIGKYVLKQAEEWARSNWNTKKVFMEVVSVRKELISYYLRRGFVNTGKNELYPYHDQRFGIPTTENLTFDILEKDL
ncbi:hypothetical protein HDV06_003207 [Boothiomyces sp. JEL0866]|nr:hypothetical protein HDV06_003207 [Boothiomyces sp. JEL0866]